MTELPKPENLLRHETSPYLLQHADNPVHWRAWGPQALAEARRYDKPILLSVGYAACHWCHVMAHESFEDPHIASVMNELYVNVKVDREERPDIDLIYQSALQMLGEHGGWPLTMFLTPDGEPFFGGTYFPSEAKYGRAGFETVLREVHRVFHSEPDKIQTNRTALKNALREMSRVEGESLDLSLPLLDEISRRLVPHMDRQNGGITGAPKFPQATFLDFLWRAYLRTGEEETGEAVRTSLTQMARGGIHDHVGGGFARYSVDSRWLVPHFEKMLYDNALLLRLYAHVWARTKDPEYRDAAYGIVAWLEREMIAPDGGFAASLDADSEGVEGKYYVWSPSEISEVLGAEAGEEICRLFDITEAGNWEGVSIPNRLQSGPIPDDRREVVFGALDTLRTHRAERVPPARDDKVLADWNGLMIAALADAGQIFDEPAWIERAMETFSFVVERMAWQDRLLHSYRAGEARHTATLDDYAAMIEAAVTLFEATGESELIEWARHFAGLLDAHYRDREGGAYFFTADDAEALIVRTKTCMDTSTPAGNGLLAGALARLSLLTGEETYRARALEIAATFSPQVHRNVFPLTSLFNAWEVLERPAQVTVVGDPESNDTAALVSAAHRRTPPSRAILTVPEGTDLPDGHPATGKTNRPGVYICIGPVCGLPVSTEDEMRLDFAQRWPTTEGADQ